MYMAHFEQKPALRTHRTNQYGSFAVLGLCPNCTHVQKSLNQSITENK
jgi:hypothetical protein